MTVPARESGGILRQRDALRTRTILLIGSTLALLLTWGVCGLAGLFFPVSGWVVWGLSAAILGVYAGAIFTDGSIRALARETLWQCLRTKVAAVFMAVLAVMLVVLPLTVKGDGTLAGRIRTFLAYSMGVTSILLTLVTILLTINLVSSDISRRQIFSLASKPLARWQYILGRWLGVVMLDVLLLAAAGGVIYAAAEYLRGGPALNAADRGTVETEVFTCRSRVAPEPVNIEGRVAERLHRLQADNLYEPAVESYRGMAGGDMKRAEVMVQEEIRKQIRQGMDSAAPARETGAGTLQWQFNGIGVQGQETRATARVVLTTPADGTVRFQADRRVVGRLVYRGPIQVAGVDGWVVRLEQDIFDVLFEAESLRSPEIARLAADQDVPITVEPTIQINCKAVPAGKVEGETVKSMWEIQGSGGRYIQIFPELPSRVATTLTIPARVVAPDGRMAVRFLNLAPVSVTIAPSDISVLYVAGGFEANFVRGLLLVLVQLIFLAGLGVLAGSFLSFPVGTLLCFVLLAIGLPREFLSEATLGAYQGDFFTAAGGVIVRVMSVLLPDFQSTSPTDSLIDGLNMSWSMLGDTAAVNLAVRTLTTLVLACGIFSRRELARVQV